MEKNFTCVRHFETLGLGKNEFKDCKHFLFDNEDNILCVFPQGKYQYQFFNDAFRSVSCFIDSTILLKCTMEKGEFYKQYRRYFMRSFDNLRDKAYDFKI